MLGLLTGALIEAGAGTGTEEDAIRSQIGVMGEDPANWGTSDVDDRHVIAAAIVGGADTLVTSDGRFDAALCEEDFDLRVIGVDAFLVDVFTEADDQQVRVSLEALARRWKRPAPFSSAQVVGRLQAPLPEAMAYLVDVRGFQRDDPPTA